MKKKTTPALKQVVPRNEIARRLNMTEGAIRYYTDELVREGLAKVSEGGSWYFYDLKAVDYLKQRKRKKKLSEPLTTAKIF